MKIESRVLCRPSFRWHWFLGLEQAFTMLAWVLGLEQASLLQWFPHFH